MMGHSACIILSVISVLCFTAKRFSPYSQQLPFFTAFFGCSEMQAFMRSAFLARFPECEFFFVLQDPGCFFHFLLFFVLLGDPQASRSFACRVGAPRGVLFSMLLVLPRGIFHFFGFASRMPWFKIIHSVRARVHGSLNILHLKGCFLLAAWQSFRTSSYFGIFSEHCCR